MSFSKLVVFSLSLFGCSVTSAAGFDQSIVDKNIEFRAQLRFITSTVCQVSIAAKNVGSRPVSVVASIPNKNQKQVDQKLIWLGYTLDEVNLFEEGAVSKPSPAELGLTELLEGEVVWISINRIAYNSENSRPSKLVVAYNIDEGLSQFFENVWVGDVVFEFEFSGNDSPKDGNEMTQ